ncbi:hypothetical protein D3C86_1948790 [compost metagenome]
MGLRSAAGGAETQRQARSLRGNRCEPVHAAKTGGVLHKGLNGGQFPVVGLEGLPVRQGNVSRILLRQQPGCVDALKPLARRFLIGARQYQ